MTKFTKAIRYPSERTLWGLPLVSIAMGPDPENDEVRGFARGVIAIGDFALGIIAIGGGACGVISIGGGSIGIISLGGGALSLLTLGGLAIGLFAFGGLAVGAGQSRSVVVPLVLLPLAARQSVIMPWDLMRSAPISLVCIFKIRRRLSSSISIFPA